MIFCFGDGQYESKGEGYQKNNRIFNVEVSHEEWSEAKSSMPTIKLPICSWRNKKEMTEEEKEEESGWETIGGLLKTQNYKEAWKVAWEKMTQKDKNKILSLPHFNKEIFTKITGIENIDDKVRIEVEGKEKYISRESAKKLNLI